MNRRCSLLLADGTAVRNCITILTSIFTYAGLMRILGNVVSLWVFGTEIHWSQPGRQGKNQVPHGHTRPVSVPTVALRHEMKRWAGCMAKAPNGHIVAARSSRGMKG